MRKNFRCFFTLSLLAGYFVVPDGQDTRFWSPNSKGFSWLKPFIIL